MTFDRFIVDEKICLCYAQRAFRKRFSQNVFGNLRRRQHMRSCGKYLTAALAVPMMLAGVSALAQETANLQKQIEQVRSVIPKFAIPMREVGDRFQNMYFAAKGGNWALAAYMSKYMNGAMNPASLTKPNEYAVWKDFYEQGFAPVKSAIDAKDFKAFDAAYNAVIANCNGCHAGMGYGFIKVVKLSAPADNGIDYEVKSNPGDVPP